MPSSPVKYHLVSFPPTDIEWEKLVSMIGTANAAIARYDGMLSAIPNPHILLSPLTTQEAVLSSKIEGTQVTMGEVLQFEADDNYEGLSDAKRIDTEEVLNYRRSLYSCVEELKEKNFSQHILRAAHHELMQGVRGQDKTPGHYRKNQNWIGTKNCKIEEASFVPIPPEHLQQGMDNWEKYFNDTNQPDTLVQLSLVHLEFEALHPFQDGNGRLGRMMIPLFLFKRNIIKYPAFYMSAYLEENKEEYIERLRNVSAWNQWTDWIYFFLNGLKKQAIENEKKVRQIISLYDGTKDKIIPLSRSQHAIQALDFLFKFGIFSASQFQKNSGIPKPTAQRILKILQENRIVKTLREASGNRPGIFAFRDLMNIAEGREIF